MPIVITCPVATSASAGTARLNPVWHEADAGGQLAEAVAELGATIISGLDVRGLWRKLFRLPRGGNWFGTRPNLPINRSKIAHRTVSPMDFGVDCVCSDRRRLCRLRQDGTA